MIIPLNFTPNQQKYDFELFWAVFLEICKDKKNQLKNICEENKEIFIF